MQNDFAHKDGVLYVPKARNIIGTISKLIKIAQQYNMPIIYVQDTHIEFRLFPKHAVLGTWGWLFIDELPPKANFIIMPKFQYYDALDNNISLPVLENLRESGIDTFLITGTLSNISVLRTMNSLSRRVFNIVYIADAIAGLNECDEWYAQKHSRDVLGATISSFDKLNIE